jgi:uncharacterized protein with NAD-binding domain and iron-sulfur cluster
MTCRRLRVAILGGGMSGLSAAYELSRTPELRARYDVTVHQMGFRLGGKLASGRNPRAALRNEEHGLHVWFGFYENTFRLAREIYESWQSPVDCPFASIWDFLKPQRHSVLGHAVDGAYRTVGVHFPRSLDTPGDGRALPSFLGLVTGVLDAARAIAGLVSSDAGRTTTPRPRLRGVVFPERDAAIFARPGEMDPALVETLHRRLDLLARFLSTRFTEMPGDVRARLAEHTHRLLSTAHPKISRTLDRITRKDAARRPLHYFVDTTLAFLRGLTNPADGIYVDGDLDRVSDRDLRAWLIENGCRVESAEKSPWIAAAYDSSFQFLGSDRARPAFEAGTAARYAIRGYLLYKHAPGYVVDAGMGEAIVAPMYEVLKERGVRFAFFHRLERMELSADKKRLARLHFVEQARVRGAYDPLFTHQGLRCWSTEPDWSQLEGGEALRARGVDFESRWSPPADDRPLSLVAGVDFDVAIVALPLGSIRADADGRTPCAEWMDAVPAVRAAAEGINLMTSVAAQLWFDRDMPDLGWDRRPAVIGWAPPLGIWCDMTPTIEHEDWPAEAAPLSVAYLCGVGATGAELASSADRDARDRARREALSAITAQLEEHGAAMWPGAATPDGSFDWSVLHDPAGGVGAERLAAQLVKVNAEPWDLCDGAQPNAFRVRLAAHESGLDNVALAGTWTKTSVATAAIETAVMSGLAAARALGAEGRTIVGEGFMCKAPVPARIAACASLRAQAEAPVTSSTGGAHVDA